MWQLCTSDMWHARQQYNNTWKQTLFESPSVKHVLKPCICDGKPNIRWILCTETVGILFSLYVYLTRWLFNDNKYVKRKRVVEHYDAVNLERKDRIRDYKYNIFQSERASYRLSFNTTYMLYRLWPIQKGRLVHNAYGQYLYVVFRTNLETDALRNRFLYTREKTAQTSIQKRLVLFFYEKHPTLRKYNDRFANAHMHAFTTHDWCKLVNLP